MILGLWGADKTCKSTLALTFPKPLAYLELDVGGFRRAVQNDKRYDFAKEVADGKILTEYKDGNGKTYSLRFPMPIQIGVVDYKNLTVRPSKIVVGMRELWYRLLVTYITLLNDPAISTIVIDTATLLWELCHTTVLQEKQEAQLDQNGNVLFGEKLRVQLTELEYREPNLRMRGLCYQAAAHNKNLVMVHHERPEYGMMMVKGEMQKAETGRMERAGWNRLGDSADLIVHTYMKKGSITPYCKVDLAEIKELEGMEIEVPTYDKIDGMLRMLRGGA
jgi:hypothetical protein